MFANCNEGGSAMTKEEVIKRIIEVIIGIDNLYFLDCILLLSEKELKRKEDAG